MMYEEAKRRKKQAGKVTLIALGILILAAGIIAGVWFLRMNSRYNKALDAYNAGDIATAHDLFSELDSFRDAHDYVKSIELSEQNKTLKATLGSVQKGDMIKFGSYEQDNVPENGDEEIEWRVLDREGDVVTLLAEYGLDCVQYSLYSDPITWEESNLRQWMNSDFIERAFSPELRAMIIDTETPADVNPDYPDAPVGNDCVDKVYALSRTESMTYIPSGSNRYTTTTDYAKEKGAYKNPDTGCGWWWTRTPGMNGDRCVMIVDWGSPYMRGGDVDSIYGCARPAMRIDISLMDLD